MSEPEPGFPTEGDIDTVLDEFDGNPREAIRALLSDLAILAADFEGSVSRGYVRGLSPSLPGRRE